MAEKNTEALMIRVLTFDVCFLPGEEKV